MDKEDVALGLSFLTTITQWLFQYESIYCMAKQNLLISSGQNIRTDPKESNKESSEMDQGTEEFDIAIMNGKEYVDIALMSEKEFDQLFSESPVSITSSIFDENVGGGVGGSDETIDYINQ